MTTYELHGRTTKAIALAAMLRSLGADAEPVPFLTDQQWSQLAVAADVHEPSDATKALVIAILERDAAARRKVEASV